MKPAASTLQNKDMTIPCRLHTTNMLNKDNRMKRPALAG
jgi:hypothetical protein